MMLRAAVYSVTGLKHRHGLFEQEVEYSVRVCMANNYSTFDRATLNGHKAALSPNGSSNRPLNGPLGGGGEGGKRAGPDHARHTTDGADHFTCSEDGYREVMVGKRAMGVGMGETSYGGARNGRSEGGEFGMGRGLNELAQLPPCFVYLLADVGTPKVR